MNRWRVLLFIALALPMSRLAQARTPAAIAPLRIGAAKVDVTPSDRELPKGSGQLDQISGDIPGATSGYIEDSFDDKVVAVWSTGAAGDQNPIYYQQTYDLRDIGIKDYATRGVDISQHVSAESVGGDRRRCRDRHLPGSGAYE